MGGNSVVRMSEIMLRSRALAVGLIAILITAGCADLPSKPSQSSETSSASAAPGKSSEPAASATSSEPMASGSGSESAVSEISSTPAAREPTPAMNVKSAAQEETTYSLGREVSRAAPIPEPTTPVEKRDAPTQEAESDSNTAKSASSISKPEAPSPVAPEPQTMAAPEQVKEMAAAPLDLDRLEKRLKETSAIGFFTKIALKDQVDELLDKFHAFYKGRSNFSLAQLRQPFDFLIMKVLALLQDNDPQLANDILASREAIWDILSDREKFAKI